MKTRSQAFWYPYKWEHCLEAYERRYPNNQHQPYLLGSVVQEETYDDATGELHKKRLSTVTVAAPDVLKKIIGIQSMIFIQDTKINRRLRRLEVHTTNNTFSGKVKLGDVTIYRAAIGPDGEEGTIFEQTAFLSLPSFLGFKTQLENFCIKTFVKNTARARQIDLIFLEEVLKDEGIHLTTMPVPTPMADPSTCCPALNNSSSKNSNSSINSNGDQSLTQQPATEVASNSLAKHHSKPLIIPDLNVANLEEATITSTNSTGDEKEDTYTPNGPLQIPSSSSEDPREESNGNDVKMPALDSPVSSLGSSSADDEDNSVRGNALEGAVRDTPTPPALADLSVALKAVSDDGAGTVPLSASVPLMRTASRTSSVSSLSETAINEFLVMPDSDEGDDHSLPHRHDHPPLKVKKKSLWSILGGRKLSSKSLVL
mmetsp:Transcript_26705/g.43655  ORF Transcript_26705/g.43655 Transcript_26705/m.43655 type:complete len:428 (+) Transcript_26705:104-1387(+)